MPVINNTQKEFERAESGTYTGVIAEVVDLGIVVDPQFGSKAMILVIWVLNQNDSEGKPFTVAQKFNQSLHEKSNLSKAVKRITGQAPAAPFNTDVLVGKSKQLIVVTENNASGKLISYIDTILPLAAGQTPLTVPANYVYTKDRKKSTFAGNPNAQQQTVKNVDALPAAETAQPADDEIPF